jgi:hypothetical protein
LCRRLHRSPGSANGVGVLQGLPDPERDEAEKWTFTMSDMPPEETVIAGLTLNGERANDPEWIALFCRVYNLRFADAEPRSPGEITGH